MGAPLETLDWIVLGIYSLILGITVWWSSEKRDTSEGYFWAGRNIGRLAIGASLFTSNIGSDKIDYNLSTTQSLILRSPNNEKNDKQKSESING